MRLQLNPIILREIRSRLRRRRTYVGLVAYVGGLGICVWCFYALFYYINTTGSNTPTRITSYNVCYTKLLRVAAWRPERQPSVGQVR